MIMDMAALQQRVEVVEAALARNSGSGNDRQKLLAIHELDRLAESLIGEQATEAQEVKNRIQQLLITASPRPDAMAYVEVYCHALR
jgi:hypothetical protein